MGVSSQYFTPTSRTYYSKADQKKIMLYDVWLHYFTSVGQPNPEKSESVRPHEGRSFYLLSHPTCKLYFLSYWHHLNNCHREKSNGSTWLLSLEVCSCLLIINRSWYILDCCLSKKRTQENLYFNPFTAHRHKQFLWRHLRKLCLTI